MLWIPKEEQITKKIFNTEYQRLTPAGSGDTSICCTLYVHQGGGDKRANFQIRKLSGCLRQADERLRVKLGHANLFMYPSKTGLGLGLVLE